jgi:NhaA family Na+:H+ antiporter
VADRSAVPSPAAPSFLGSEQRLARLARPITRFLQIEASSGILLAAAAVCALVWANSPWQDAYHALWATPIAITIGPLHFSEDLGHFVNDGLMAVFFFVVGLEIKRELVADELRDRRTATVPIVAAIGGMVVPALTCISPSTPASPAAPAGASPWPPTSPSPSASSPYSAPASHRP